MATHVPWSREELSLLLRAWADVAARESKPRNVYHAIFQHYQALCSAARAPARAEPSVHNRRKSLENMHAVISLFLTSLAMAGDDPHSNSTTSLSQESSRIDGGGGGNGGGETITSSYPCNGKLHAWFDMPETKRRRWFAAHNRKSYLYTEITEEHFETITEILTISNGGIPPPPPVYVFKPEASIEAAAPLERKTRRRAKRKQLEPTLSEQELTAAMARARESFRIVMERFVSKNSPETTSTKEDDDPIAAAAAVVVVEEEEEDEELLEVQAEASPPQEPAVVPPPLPLPQRSNSVAEESGSATESEDDWEEIVPPSPVREAEQESDAAAVTKQVSTDLLRADTFNSKSEIESPKRKFSPTSDASLTESATHPDNKRSKPVEPEIFTLLSSLENQTRTLKEAYRNTKLARRRDQAERQSILRSLRQEQNERQQILETLRRQEEDVRQQRAAWRREQEEIRREYAELLDSN